MTYISFEVSSLYIVFDHNVNTKNVFHTVVVMYHSCECSKYFAKKKKKFSFIIISSETFTNSVDWARLLLSIKNGHYITLCCTRFSFRQIPYWIWQSENRLRSEFNTHTYTHTIALCVRAIEVLHCDQSRMEEIWPIHFIQGLQVERKWF